MIIVVSHKKWPIHTADGLTMQVREAQVGGQLLQECQDFGHISRITFRIKLGILSFPLVLPTHLERAVREVLGRYHAKGNIAFDCYAFANYVAGLPVHPVRFLEKFWSTRLYSGRSRAGDVVFFTEESTQTFLHAALYLGFGLYISIWGAGGDFEIATLSDMKHGYGATTVLRADPRVTSIP